MKRVLSIAVLAVWTAVAGCARGAQRAESETASTDAGMTGAGMDTHAHEAALPAVPGPGYTVTDVRFMQHMIGHHLQAIEMARLAPSRDASEALLRLAEKIDISQTDEIIFMREWLAERNQAVPTDEQAMAISMPGMLTPEQMAELRAAHGAEFDRLFLTYMIQHHGGALQMVEDLFEDSMAGQDPDLFRFVTDVDADQRDEIFAMENLLAEIGDGPAPGNEIDTRLP